MDKRRIFVFKASIALIAELIVTTLSMLDPLIFGVLLYAYTFRLGVAILYGTGIFNEFTGSDIETTLDDKHPYRPLLAIIVVTIIQALMLCVASFIYYCNQKLQDHIKDELQKFDELKEKNVRNVTKIIEEKIYL